jgi:hypothetical protein
MNVKFNVNNPVRVRITPEGRKLISEPQRIPVTGGIITLDPIAADHKEDAEGWSEWQLWELAQVFGPHIYLGCNVPFETEIQLLGVEPL